MFSPETPYVRDAVKRSHGKGFAAISLVSDLRTSKRDHFVGIDNVSAARFASVPFQVKATPSALNDVYKPRLAHLWYR